MAQSYSGTIHREYNGKRYSFRTATLYNTLGRSGTIVTNSAKTTLQLDLGGLTGFVNVAERNASGSWTFTENVGDAIKQDLIKRGPGSLTAQLDNATLASLKTNARITDAQAKQALDISQNITGTTALVAPNQSSDGSGGGTNPPNGSQTGGSSAGFTPEGSEQGKKIISTGIKARAQYASSSELKYPSEYDGNDFLTINMLRYVSESNLGLGVNPSATGEGEDKTLTFDGKGISRPSERLQVKGRKNVLATISLPIPANLVDGNLVGWGNGDLTALEAYGAGAASRLMQSGFGIGEQAGKEVSAAGQALRNNKDAVKTVITANLAAKIIGITNRDLLSRSTGAILNPNSELLFNGPQLRTFTFSFKMTPRHKKESVAIRKIIRTLKQGMAPKSTASGIFLAAPNIFELEFKYVDPKSKKSKRHPFLPVLKPCALQNLSVNYMPDGSYMTYGDGSMIAYDMTCTFAELEPIFDQDYDELEKTDKTDSKGNPIYDQDSLIGY